MFIAVLFTIAKILKQSKYPSTDEGIKKMWFIHTMEYNSDIKKEWKFAICYNMDGPGEYYTKWNKSDRDKCCMLSVKCGIWKKKRMNITKLKLTHKYREQTSGYRWGEGRREGQDRGRWLRDTNYSV